MFSSPRHLDWPFRSGKRLALLGAVLLSSCSRQASPPPEERIAILRFENLSPDSSADWMGRGLAEAITSQLRGQPDRYAISATTLHTLNRTTGSRPSLAPGISAEQSLAVIEGANLIGYGDYEVRGDRVQARLFLEDVPARRYRKVVTASGSATDVIGVATSLARQIAVRTTPATVSNDQALLHYVRSLEGTTPEDILREAQQSIAADPGFTPPYRVLAELTAQTHDPAAALSLLDEALRHTGNNLERGLVQLQIASLRKDVSGRLAAMKAVAAADPGNPEGWRSTADLAFSTHHYADAAAAFRKFLLLQPEDKQAMNLLGYSLAWSGDITGAAQALRQYQAAAPSEADPLDSMGDCYLLTGHLKEAEQSYLAAYQKNPKYLQGGDLFKASVARLLAGDVAGATEIHSKYVQALAAFPGRLPDVETAEWMWVSGKRREAVQQLSALAKASETTGRLEIASHCDSELAIWNLLMGDRTAAAELAHKALSYPHVPVSAPAAVALFLAQPPAPASEWSARAEKVFRNPALGTLRDLAEAAALLLDKNYAPARDILQRFYDNGTQTPVDEGIPAMLAWTLLETGRDKDAAALLRLNPIPPATGFNTFSWLYFPRFFYLRGESAEKTGQADAARESYRIFLQLSGSAPLAWGEEAKAKAAAH